ncbi:putative porin [Pedobacter frigoris]|uniref:putative porin n=1 Tax=Pedobacter frigoris TaxID=2571272 RepID=UPI00293181C3|nr:putative porin [Pedobacter frigoris]
MYKNIAFIVFCLVILGGGQLFAQDLKTSVNDNKELDSLRKKEENAKDSIIFTSRFIRYTTLRLTKDSIQTLALDTTLQGFHNFNILVQPKRPTVGVGNLGLSAMPLLFEPVKTIGFDAGFHTLDYYALTHDDIKYYQARTPFTSLYYVSAGEAEQVFRVVHSQNIKPNFNIGANFNRIGANGYYSRQRGDDLNGALFSWYQSPNKRYNLWTSAVFNTLKANENGAPTNDTLFTGTGVKVDHLSEPVRLSNSRRIYRQSSFMLKQTYFVGRIDSLAQEITKKILPTNKVSYTFKYSANSYGFRKDQADDHSIFPRGALDTTFTNDSTRYTQVQNEFIYSFFLRAKSSSLIKNELKLDAGIRHDFYKYNQMSLYKNNMRSYDYSSSFQNVTLLGTAGYRFSNRIDLNVDLQQIFQGRNTGDFLYEAKSNVLLSKSIGRIVLGAYFQNKSPEEIYNNYVGNHYNWSGDAQGFKFDRTKTINMSFNYIIDKLNLDAGAQYFLIDKYLYFEQVGTTGPDTVNIRPAQAGSTINLLKITLGKKITFGKFNLDSYIVYQKTDNSNILRTPEVYTFNSFYIDQTFFKVLKTNVGFDIRYNTPYYAYSYSVPAGQFYIGDKIKYKSEPVLDVWVKASLRRANLFVKCDYINQGLLSKGYYTVKSYPMPDRLLFKFGVSWNFYD